MYCADCGEQIGNDDGRTVCQACCVADTKLLVEYVISGLDNCDG